MTFDLPQLVQRLTAAVARIDGLAPEVSATDLILAKNGYGAGARGIAAFVAQFLRPDESLRGVALDRLEREG